MDMVYPTWKQPQRLKTLELETSDSVQVDWPTTLIGLKSLQLNHAFSLGYDGPHLKLEVIANWQHYNRLQTLTLLGAAPWQIGQMPDWFSSLKMLTRLDMPKSRGLDFGLCWKHFSQLHLLGLMCYSGKLSEDVMVLAGMPHLTYLSFGDMSSYKSLFHPAADWQDPSGDHTI